MIVRMSLVLNRSVVDSDWRFDNLCSSHLQSQKVVITCDNFLRGHNHGFRWLGPRVFVKCWNLFYWQEKFHKQVYGISISSSKSNIAIIENPEMLKIQQRHIMKQQTLANTSKPSAPPPPLVSSTGTPTKQESSAVNGKFLDSSQIPALNYDLLKVLQALLLVRMASSPCVMHCTCLTFTRPIQYYCGFLASLSSFPCINPHSRKVCV